VLSAAETAGRFSALFELMLWAGLGTGVFFMLLVPLHKRLMHGVR